MKRGELRRRHPMRSTRRKRANEAVYALNRSVVYLRGGGRCELCDVGLTMPTMNAHHRLPRSAGRDDRTGNLLAVCSGCHAWVHGHPLMSVAAGASITRTGKAPDAVAVRLFAGWFLLTNHGDKIALPDGPESPMVA